MTIPLRGVAVFLVGGSILAGCEGDSSAVEEAALLTPAEGNCIISAETRIGTSGITVARTETGGEFTSVYLNVPNADAQWLCQATPTGQVQDISYLATEGAL